MNEEVTRWFQSAAIRISFVSDDVGEGMDEVLEAMGSDKFKCRGRWAGFDPAQEKTSPILGRERKVATEKRYSVGCELNSAGKQIQV